MSVLSENKDYLLPLAGIVVVLIIITLSLSGDTTFGINQLFGFNQGAQTSQNGTGKTGKSNKYTSAPKMSIDLNKSYSALVKTSKGEIVIKLLPKLAPITVNNFVFLAKDKFYDGLTFHRIIPKGLNIIQGGDPIGNGTGGPGYNFKDEINADSLGLNSINVADASFLKGVYSSTVINTNAGKTVKAFYESLGYEYINSVQSIAFKTGVIAMANSGPNTNGSQFFITMTGAENYTKHLDGKHTVFGEVISGQSVIDAIGNEKTSGNEGKPATAIYIESVTITEL